MLFVFLKDDVTEKKYKTTVVHSRIFANDSNRLEK